jgi:molybdopterin-containing oxidoreductase family membrane subunit
LYSALSLGYRGSPLQDKYLHQALDIMAIIIIPTAIIAYSLLSWLFGMSLRPGWHSTIFGPYFVVTASYSGIALLILIMWIYRKTNRIGSILTNQHFNYMSFGLLIVGLFYTYFTFSEYITEWYNITETTAKLFSKFFLGSRFGWMAMIHIFCAIVIPIIVLGIPWFRTVTNVTIVSLLVVIGLWVKRYLIVVPTLETPFIPIQDIRPAWANYSVSWVELALTISGIALVVLIFTIASKIAPIIPVSEIEDMDEPKPVVEYTMRGI